MPRGKAGPQAQARAWLARMIQQGYLALEDEGASIRITEKGRQAAELYRIKEGVEWVP